MVHAEEHKRIVVSNLEESFDQQKQLQGNVKNPGGGKEKYFQSPGWTSTPSIMKCKTFWFVLS